MAQFIPVTDFLDPALDVYARATENQLLNRADPTEALFIAESPLVIGRALDAGCVPVSLLMETKHIETRGHEIIARCGDIPVFTGESDVLASLTGYQLTRGILCAMKRPAPLDAGEICAASKRIAILEGIVDQTNVGAIFRAAAALNMDGILLTPTCCDPLTRRAVRVSMGTVFQIPWAYIGENVSDWPENGMAILKQHGFKTAAMALDNRAISIDDEALTREDKLAIVLGTEGDGLSAKTIADCNYTVMIPMAHGVDSLNVAAASAVAFWQLGKR